MKINKFFAIILGLAGVTCQAYFWEDWRQPRTQEEIEKRDIDLKYQEKMTNVEQKKAKEAAQAQQKQQDLNYKKHQLELQRKRDRLKLDN